METALDSFDSQELLHLAIIDSQDDNNESAMVKLKRAIELEPDNAPAHFMLGAIYAEIQMYDRAISEFEKSVSLDPDFPIARFQLGLLQATLGQVAEAESTWSGLDSLDSDHYLLLFKNGLLKLLNNEFADSIELLTLGIANNFENPALNLDMQRMAQEAQAAIEAQSGERSPSVADEPENAGNSSHILLSGYRNTDPEKNN